MLARLCITALGACMCSDDTLQVHLCTCRRPSLFFIPVPLSLYPFLCTPFPVPLSLYPFPCAPFSILLSPSVLEYVCSLVSPG